MGHKYRIILIVVLTMSLGSFMYGVFGGDRPEEYNSGSTVIKLEHSMWWPW